MNAKNSKNKEKILKILKKNNGYLTSKEVTANGISREYLNVLVKENIIEKVDRGIYIDANMEMPEDPFLVFQMKYPNTIYSHFTALAFHNMTEVISYKYEITAIQGKRRKDFNKCQVFYVKPEVFNLGKITIKSNYGNEINVYDKERCICDIIKSINREDIEQVKKVLKNYVNKLDIQKINEYSKKMGINNKVIDYVRRYVE